MRLYTLTILACFILMGSSACKKKHEACIKYFETLNGSFEERGGLRNTITFEHKGNKILGHMHDRHGGSMNPFVLSFENADCLENRVTRDYSGETEKIRILISYQNAITIDGTKYQRLN